MTKAQWKAVNDFCQELGYERRELLEILKSNGTLARNAKLDDLDDYVNRKDYDSMLKFLENNV